MSGELEGRRVIITGAAGGIGAAAVQGFVERGARVAAIYNRTPGKGALADKAQWVCCDLTDKAQVLATFERIAAEFGGLDALLHIAGTWRGTPADEVDESQIDFLMAVNLKATIFTNQAAFRMMKGHGGRIVNFGSVEGVEGNVRSPIYAASKAAVHAWTRSAARDWGQHHVNVNAVAPVMRSPLFDYNLGLLNDEQKLELERTLRERIPIDGTMGEPLRDAVPLLAFLAGDGSRFITGQLISVDGGLRMLGA